MSASVRARGTSQVREWLKRHTSPRTREGLRRLRVEIRIRAVDFLPDRLEAFRQRDSPLPPPKLRRRVAGTSSRKFFLRSGREALDDLLRVFSLSRDPTRTYPEWLDFGCGCGRVARHFSDVPEVRGVAGIDVDSEQIAWCRRHLAGDFQVISPHPPTGLASAAFDVVYAGSVFTHFDEEPQHAWLRELHRLLKPGGRLIASTHGPSLIWARPDLGDEQRARLASPGFLFASGRGSFNEDTAFHSRDYLLASWGSLFGLLCFEELGLNRFQDLHVWCKW